MTTTKKATNMNTKQMDDAVKVGRQAIEKTVTVTKAQMEKASETTLKSYEDVAVASKENVDAVVSSATVFSKGFEDLSKAYYGFAQTTIESQVEAAKAFFGARNVNDFLEVQNEYMRTNFDKMAAESARLSEMTMKVANDVFAPIQAQANATIERTTKQLAQ